MATELATAYISLVPSTKGLAEGINKYFEGMSKPAQSQGKSVGISLTQGIDKALKVGALAVGATAVAGIGTALVKGFKRLDALDQATAKLSGLGHSAKEVKGIMNDALVSVKGTAFGLDEAATVAASAVASGVKPGKDLQGVLKTVADTATIAGASMSDTGAIFGSVAARGKLQGDDLMQLQSRGVPVLQFLAKHYGITAQAASEMVSKGDVDFKNFNAAMKENLGGAALKSGNTFSGAMDNVGASIGRIGANLLSGLFPAAKTGLGGLLKWLEPIESGAKGVGAAIGNVIKWLQQNIVLVRNLAIVVGSMVAAYLAMRGVLAIMNAFKATMAVVKALQLGYAAATYGSVGATYAATAATTAQRVAMIAGGVAAKAAAAAQWLFNAALSANPIVLIILAIAALVAGLIWFFTQTKLGKEIWANVCAFFVTVWTAVVDFFIAAWTNVSNFFATIWNFIVLIVTTYINLVSSIITNVINFIVTVWTAVWDGISSVVSTVWGAIVGFVTFYITTVMGIIQAVGSTIAAVWNGIWNGIVSFFVGAWNNIMSVVNTVGSAFGNAFSSVSGIVSNAFNGIVGVIRGAINSVIDLVNGAIGAINDTVGAAGAAFGVNIKIGKIPRLADGGIVSARPGGVLANIGEGRYDEAVVPLSPKVLDTLGGGKSDQPIYTDAGTLLGWIRQVANGEARLVWNTKDRSDEMATVGGLR